MKNMKKNGIILLLITIVVLFFVLKDDFGSIANTLLTANYIWIGIALIFIVIYILFETLAFHQIVKSYKHDYKFKKSLRLMIITHFFNGITPFSTGGQPMQIYMLKKDGFRLTKATNVIMQNFILYQVALVVYGLIAIFLNYQFDIFAAEPFLRRLILIGFFINAGVMVVLALISFSNSFNHFITKVGINILHKLKIVKDKEKQHDKWQERCDDFHEGAIYLRQNKTLCIKGFIYNICSLTALYIIPLFVILGLKGDQNVDINIINTITASSYVLIIGSFVPIPGASGGIEFGYMRFFGNFVKGPLLSASLLIWRTLTYYLPMIVGSIVFNTKGSEDKQ